MANHPLDVATRALFALGRLMGIFVLSAWAARWLGLELGLTLGLTAFVVCSIVGTSAIHKILTRRGHRAARRVAQ